MFRFDNTEATEIKITPEELDKLRKRSEALKNTDEIKQLQAKKSELEKLIYEKIRAVLNEQHEIDKKTIIKISSKMKKLPKIIPEQPLESLLDLLKMISRKFAINVVHGELNLLTDNVCVVFPKHLLVGDEIEGQNAITYLKLLGGKESTRNDDYRAPSHLSKQIVTLTHSQCKAAIQGLILLADPTKQEIAKIKSSSYGVLC